MADQKINALPVKTSPTTGDRMLMIGAAEEYQIDYDQLATAILNKLTSKTFTLDQGTKSLVAALNELNSKFPNAEAETVATLTGGSTIRFSLVDGFCYLRLSIYEEDVPSVSSFNSGTIYSNVPEKFRPGFEVYGPFIQIDVEGMYAGCCVSIRNDGLIRIHTRYKAVSPSANTCRAYACLYYMVDS